MVEYKALAVPFEVAQPKYARLVQVVQQRIEDGTYPVGSLLPTEAGFAQEFGCSRPTVVRALEILARNGWIQAQQGRGRFVMARRAAEPERRGAILLALDEAATGVLLGVARVDAPIRVREMLKLADGTSVLLRQVLVVEGGGPVELVSTYFTLAVAEGTDLGSGTLVPGGIKAHLEDTKRIRLARATESVTARDLDEDEAEALEAVPGTSALVIWIAVSDSAGNPVFAMENVLLPNCRELEAAYALA
ncbi:GntR family transcriptional regulator [Yinghuangia sp. ASG 101]|uniref:GntR family transcriptional regulator n=1 Tax=Yinghuangia sp. ASG 101 TaxID=2896848 RepID=UPI001E633DF8|nr:GntR family transcriptional regulator [Yinghuangia sp. ASG 101]UGQ11365.1 GntR family transcriptional regulator [Yinghuangia sp. ASG 101]